MEAYKGERFLDKLYRDLYKSEEVNRKYVNVYDKFNNIRKYLERLEKCHLLATTSERDIDLVRLKNLYYDKYIIKEENIPSKYFLKHKNSSKDEVVRKLIESQKESFDVWFNYLNSNDALKYPMWVRYYVFQGVISLGAYDPSTLTFQKREKNTTDSFPLFNESIVSFIMNSIYEAVDNNKQVDDEVINKLLKEGSFKRLFEFCYKNQFSSNKKVASIDGFWKFYPKGDNYLNLFLDLKNKGTNWCVEKNRVDAIDTCSSSDLYIYYSYDKDNLIPRSAIEVVDNKVVEVRGILNNQNLEDEVLDLTIDKANDFEVSDIFLKKFNDSKRIREILSKDKFSIDDLRFIYEIDDKISFLGYQLDNRFIEFRNNRNIKDDLGMIFSCSSSQVGEVNSDLTRDDLVCYYGDITCYNEYVDDIIIPPYVVGSLNMRLLKNSYPFSKLVHVSGDLCLDNLEEVDNLTNLASVGGIDCDNILDRVKNKEGEKNAKK